MDELTLTEQLTPFLPLLGTLLGAAVVGVFAVWNRKRGAVETRAPDVNEMWSKQERDAQALDAERKHRRALEDFAEFVQDMFRAYVRRVKRGGDIDLTEREKSAHDADMPAKN